MKVLNRQAGGKEHKVAVQALALDAAPGKGAFAEAREKQCGFLLYVRLKSLANSTKVDPNNFYSGIPIALTDATLEYLVRRTSDGAYAKGSASNENRFVDDAILRATDQVGSEVLSRISTATSFQAAEPGYVVSRDESPAEALNTQIFVPASFCNWLPSSLAHAEALRQECEFAFTQPQKLPRFTCEQETSRYKGSGRVPVDLITASVRYQDGQESYSNIKRNGKLDPEANTTPGLWSTGVFEGNLRNIFDPKNQAKFEFTREDKLREHKAWVFHYQIERQNERLWVLRQGEQTDAPPYEGELWVDQETGALLRFGSFADSLAPTFPIQSADVVADYEIVDFRDGTSFVLPVLANIETLNKETGLSRNVVRFEDCHKFRAKTQIVLGPASAEEGGIRSEAKSAESEQEELERSETIYNILREQAIREDEQRTAAEQQAQLDALTQAAFQKLAALEKMRQQRVQAATSRSTPASTGSESLPMLKVSVRLVPVSVVVRDAKGNTVGDKNKEDFLLFDERKPQVITQFWVEHAAESNGPEKEVGKVTRETAPEAEVPAPVQVENNVAYVFDDLHIAREDLKNTRDAAARHLAELAENDRAALFTTSGEIGIDFTSDREKLLAALRGLKAHPQQGWDCPPISYYTADLIVNHADGAASDIATADAKECARYAPSGGPTGGVAEAAMAQRLAASRAVEVALAGRVESERALGMLDQVIARTAAMPGRKTIVLVSPGILTVAPDAQGRAMALINRAVQSNIVVNTLDVTGLSTPLDAGGHFADTPERGQLARQETLARNEIMADLAYGTGGTFFHNNNDLNEGFRRTADMPEYIYVLGFSPQKLDGKFHKLKVDLKAREELTVQARPGYYAVKPAATQ